MKNCHVRLLLSLLVLNSCGDTSPLDSAFWTDPKSQRSQSEVNTPVPEIPVNSEETIKHTYIVNLFTLSSANLGEIAGRATIDVNDTDVTTSLDLVEVPQTLMIGQRSLTHKTCSEIAAAYPPPAVVTMNTEFKAVTDVDLSSREALMRELNQIDGHNGDAVDLEGKTYVVKAYVETFNTPGPSAGELIPIACGTILRE
jgi:hypothetical protein